jgi:uncharacterized protein
MWGKLVTPLRRTYGLALLAAIAAVAPVREVGAARFPNLYQVTVAPDPTAANQRAAAEALALAKVLVRVTGDRNAAFDTRLQALLADPNLVNSYGDSPAGRAQKQVGFNARIVDSALKSLSWPVWGSERPLILVWIAIDDGVGGRAILGANDPGPETSPTMVELLATIRADLDAVADERGLLLALPLLDLEDLNAVTFLDIWAGYEDRLSLASTRYRADAVLIGRVRPGVLGNEVQWLLLKDGERSALTGITLRDGLDSVADLYAGEFGVVGDASTARLTVLDVGSLDDYGKVMSYLDGLSVLQSVDVESFERGVLSLRVRARGDARVIERVLALGGVLSPAGPASAPGAPGGAGTLSFRLSRGAGP